MHIYLQTDRLLLRRFTPDDADLLVELNSDPQVMRFVSGGTPTPRAVIEHDFLPRYLAYYQRYAGFGFWPSLEVATGSFVGWFLFRPPDAADPATVELGYRLRKAAWGKGYATEGSVALIRRGFTELGVQRVVASAVTANLASRRVLEKAGLKLTRTYTLTEPELLDVEAVEYALEKADWEQHQAAAGAARGGSEPTT